MNELKAQLTAQGLSDEQATKVIITVAEFAKARLPESLHGMIEDVLAGKSPDSGGIGGFLGGLFK